MKGLFPVVKLCPFSLPVGGTTNETLTNFIQVKMFHPLQALILKGQRIQWPIEKAQKDKH
jgi:hypothetical protein